MLYVSKSETRMASIVYEPRTIMHCNRLFVKIIAPFGGKENSFPYLNMAQ